MHALYNWLHWPILRLYTLFYTHSRKGHYFARPIELRHNVVESFSSGAVDSHIVRRPEAQEIVEVLKLHSKCLVYDLFRGGHPLQIKFAQIRVGKFLCANLTSLSILF